MQEIKKKLGNEYSDPKKKERHIVTWTQEEDDTLREQISIHGTENWAIIASKFKDKTTRQCRRRWYTYLNSDFKKGGWSPEEDLLLCEAQKIFGNRWTEIAKVVSGRTDNAVKNRFSTLCKKRAKYEALAKENASSYMNQNDKRVIIRNGFNTDGTSENTSPLKKMRRSHIPSLSENCNYGDRRHGQCGKTNQQLRAPFTVLIQNIHSVNNLQDQHNVNISKEAPRDAAQTNKFQGSFLKKDDPKITALMQQAELLSSLAMKVNTDNTDQSLENAWKVLQDFLNQSKESDILSYGMSDFDFQLEDLKYLLEDLRSTSEGGRPSWRQPDLYDESPGSSEYSTGSTLLSQTECYKMEQIEAEIGTITQDIPHELQTIHIGEQNNIGELEKGIVSNGTRKQAEILPSCDEATNDDAVVSALSSTEFSSPIQVTPMFRSLAAGIPSPKFSDSERSFLLKTLGADSPFPNPSTNSQTPLCKRALLQSL
ncbi:putative transcription factor MYB-HB-like family [Rosa chinensis]|uniref:Putative transcription factor MYB-HB-like family n=1 Tax=Rosa chinensis TaxID=74649 RepID=A0A2P6R364_ROSCH|nr:transcription factor MYB124 isoform X1 [Rosa chinensis]PRQ40819.1 putative transcription factor MYB-HB-like family [Rosa chinensis]